MLFQVIEENGQKKIQPLTADTGAGNPVGTIIVVCSNQIPSNYLPLGTQYDTSLYPVLYALLGTDTTPTASALGLPTLTSGQYVIKATSGLSENAQDNVINTLNEQRSYSTEEHLTGKKWIDGKPIYSKTVNFGALPNNTTKTVAHNISNLNEITKIEGIAKGTFAGDSTVYIQLGHASNTATEDLAIVDNNINIITTTDRTNFTAVITLEYTKTNG